MLTASAIDKRSSLFQQDLY